MNQFQLKSFLLQSGLVAEFVVFSCIVLIALSFVFLPKQAYGLSIWITIFALLAGFYFSGFTPTEGSFSGFHFWTSTPYLKRFFYISGSVAFFCFLEWKFGRNQPQRPEPFIFLLLSIISLCLMVQANSFVVLFLSAELFSICSYGLVKPDVEGDKQVFSVVHYFGLGALASAIGLFGLSWMVGLQGISSFPVELIPYLAIVQSIAAVLFISFLLFKLGSFPFHFWVPKIYENAPTPIVGFISVAPKVAAAFSLLWVVEHVEGDLTIPLMAFVFFGVLLGSLAAYQAESLKNIFAFSSIAQAAILIVPAIFYKQIPNSENQLLIYAISYALAAQAAFCAIQYFENHIHDGLSLKHLSGQFSNHPLPSLLFVIVILSIIGLPPTIGFTAKLLIISTLLPALANWESWSGILVFVTLVLSTILSLGYFYRIPFLLIFKSRISESLDVRSSLSSVFWLFLVGIFVFLAFVKPSAFFSL